MRVTVNRCVVENMTSRKNTQQKGPSTPPHLSSALDLSLDLFTAIDTLWTWPLLLGDHFGTVRGVVFRISFGANQTRSVLTTMSVCDMGKVHLRCSHCVNLKPSPRDQNQRWMHRQGTFVYLFQPMTKVKAWGLPKWSVSPRPASPLKGEILVPGVPGGARNPLSSAYARGASHWMQFRTKGR